MEKIKLANETIKHLKDYVEVRKALKKVSLDYSKENLSVVEQHLIDVATTNVLEIRKEETNE